MRTCSEACLVVVDELCNNVSPVQKRWSDRNISNVHLTPLKLYAFENVFILHMKFYYYDAGSLPLFRQSQSLLSQMVCLPTNYIHFLPLRSKFIPLKSASSSTIY